MKTPAQHTKIKVITGYILLFLLTIITILFIYKQITRLTGDEGLISKANQKLFIVGNTITNLYEAESLSNSFLQTGSGNSFRKYIGLIHQVETDIDTLKKLTSEPAQIARIDTIYVLLNDKIKNLKELIKVKKSQSPDEYYTKAIALIESTRDSVQDIQNVQKRIVTTLDSSYVKNKKKRKGFLGIFGPRLPDSTLEVKISQHIVLDTIHAQVPEHNTDSIVNILKAAWENFQAETAILNRQISQKEYNIVTQSVLITEQLKKVLYAYEMEEITHSMNRIEQREQLRNTTANLIAKIAIIAVLFIAFFCTLILRDISRNQRYRRELEAAKNYTDRLLKMREKFMLTVTHDIKSPLGSIIGYIELLKKTLTHEKQRYFLSNMKSSAEHIQQLVMNLLDFSKLEANKIQPDEIIFHPAGLLQEIYDSFLPQARSKKLKYTCRLDPSLAEPQSGDALRIRQITANILSNAIKYTPRGEVVLEAAIDPKSRQLTIRVKDSGPGLSAEEQKQIFNEFTRLSSSNEIEGTGLGLAITLKLVHLLGGDLHIDSSPGQGSCFTVTLPLKEGGKAKAELQKETDLPTLQAKALVIDDDPLQLQMMAALLESYGVQADITTSPDQLAEKIERENYDLIFTDIQMPQTDGFEVVKRIRESALPRASSIPVIALSARCDLKEEDYKKAGFTAFWDKTLRPETFPHLLRKLTEEAGWTTPLTSIPVSGGEERNKERETGNYTLKHIRQFTDNDPEALKRILESFLQETRKHLEQLNHDLQEKDYPSLGKLAHKMLPVFRQLEAKEIIPSLQRLERSDKEPLSESEFSTLTESILTSVRELCEKIRQAADYSKE